MSGCCRSISVRFALEASSLFKPETNRGSEPPSVFTDRSSRSFNLHNPMAREERPLGRKCLAPRKDHRKSVRPLRNAGKETRRRNKDAKKTGRMGKMLPRGVGGKDGRGCEKGRGVRENEVAKG